MTPKMSTGEKQRLVKTKTEMGSSAYERAKAFESKNPFHISVMYPYYVSSRLTIPLAFAKKHFLGQLSNNNDLVLVSGGRSWPAKCTRSGDSARINGWKAFVVDNKLKVGDVCILEIMKGKKLSVNIIVFPADD
ncbi:PREDICTED: B3 domain-containing protein REM19-like [Ipomoea nil]|uniref:B3 domain-containing protein REM19-like n=1 Tax=Ipomoea nil TaxID=35883 RepID=UPI0009012A71|nr:PREDICTED: B3 domain-containing protein REM19-like [Ipomoea nil]